MQPSRRLALGFAFAFGLVAVGRGDALADPARCATADADLAWRGTDLAEISGDTGWFPAGFVAQLRLSGRVVGHTAVEAGVRTTGCWAGGMQAIVDGRPGTGWLDVAYGAELRLQGRIHATVLGKTIDWEGDIPLPAYIPTSVLVEGQTEFDPAIDGNRIARVADSSPPITLLATNALDGIIDVVGISGGLRVTATPVMTTSYRTRGATLDGQPVGSSLDRVAIERDGFGEALELAIAADGLVRYQPSLIFHASFDVRIFGYQVVDWDIGSVAMNLPALERPVTLTGDPARLALPVLEGVGEGARMDFADGATQELRVRNAGEGPLAIAVASAPAGVTAEPLVIAAGDEAVLRVTAGDEGVFAEPATLVLTTSDPDHPEVTIQLGKDVGGTDPGEDPEAVPAGGCTAGGAVGPGASLLLALLVVAAAGRRRRRTA